MDIFVNEDQAARDLIEIMVRQTEKLELFLSKEEALQGIVSSCDYSGLQAAIGQLSPLSEEIDSLERQRDEAFRLLVEALGQSAGSSFYEVAVRLPSELRDRACGEYRKMKSLVIRIQGMTMALDAYVRSVSGTVGKILDQAIPQRRGTIYNRRGITAAADQGPLLVSREM